MRDDWMGGLLAVGIAAPVMIVCCGGGVALLAATFGGIGAWLTGFGGISIALVAAVVFLVVREFRRSSKRGANSNSSIDRKTQS
ncbi:hypothetical protein RA2_04272 [Roseovarius sp. A-2]|uniref:hypothetical protein n=1 Tax=Roseovarius sp. A-2 TaxID=1570360 RepID=UPI0009C8E96F|nr:hypothetical protein [Roseovarius sp. A-2]GAW37196.1 hypothetical protein RA2_04272 [Roseovarius sp. A-2]